MLAAGKTYSEISRELGCSSAYVARWKARFQEHRLAGLDSRYAGRKAWVITPEMEARVLAMTRQAPPDGSTHWTSRKLGKVLKISHVTVAKIWSRAGIKPHRIERYMASDDPDFEAKAADVIGLYLDPPKHAAIFSLDEKSHIQALDRLHPALPLTLAVWSATASSTTGRDPSLYAALDTLSGEVFGKTVRRRNQRGVRGIPR